MPKVLIVGFFDFEKLDTGGQPVKTRELYTLLCEKYDDENIYIIETKGWKKKPLNLLLDFYKKTKLCDIFIMLPAHNGVGVFGRIFAFIKKKTGKKIFYDVIGGWLSEKLEKEPKLKRVLKHFDGIWVETSSMKKGLNDLGLDNVVVIPNFKTLTPLKEEQLVIQDTPPFKLCTFSRVIKEKGIEDAINAVKNINHKNEKVIYTLDIYGQIPESYKQRFEDLQSDFPEYISYKGCVSPSSSVEILKDYFALLFPTHYYTEGVPGTLIDAYAAGVPVIAPLWLNYKDVFEDGITGWGYEFDNYDEFLKILDKVSKEPQEFVKMKAAALNYYNKFTDKNAFNIIKKMVE